MSKDKVRSMAKHRDELQSRLSSGIVPERQKGKEVAYKAFLTRELKVANKKLEDLALTVTKK